jgi:hypothetical protein
VTNPSPWNEPGLTGYAEPLASDTMPAWAKTYRIVLMVFGGFAMLALLVITICFSLPASMYEPGGLRAAGLGILLSLLYAVGSIPYLIANLVYTIRWATSLRGRGYAASGLSSTFLVAAPIVVAASIITSAFFLWGR